LDLASRMSRTQAALAAAGVDILVVAPGPDLRYLTGYDALPLERLTALVLPAHADPFLVVPQLEAAEAERSPAGLAGLEIRTWKETDDPYALVADALGPVDRLAVDNHMWAEKVFAFEAAIPRATCQVAGAILSELRMRKTPDEVNALRQAGAAIDRVHQRMQEFLKPGRTEREIARDIGAAIVAEGHVRADFVIVGSGPNGASPHHDVSDRVVEVGDPVVVDIGGTTQAGYRSDSTRTYVAGGSPPQDFLGYYAVLLEAQVAQCDFAAPGVTAESVDRVGRTVIEAAGYGVRFIHRTGHGIGLETHEEPYIVEGSQLVLEPGMAFSIEPGIYLPGRHGARIEDIVVVTDDGIERLNTTSRELKVLEA
jgi:Xaa-Pro aminopeptidase